MALVSMARRAGEPADQRPWDHAPARDAANEYVRDHMDWAEAGPRSRFPPLEAPD